VPRRTAAIFTVAVSTAAIPLRSAQIAPDGSAHDPLGRRCR